MKVEFYVTSSNPGRHPSHALVARADLVIRRATLPPVRVDTFGGAASVALGRTAREELYVGRRDEDEEVVRLRRAASTQYDYSAPTCCIDSAPARLVVRP